jgi:MFS family permease
VNAGRKTTMLACALCVVPILFAAWASSLWVAVGLISLATAAHEGWSANLFTLVSDMFPRRAVASVAGIGGFAGSVIGMMIATATGYLLQWTGSYTSVVFVTASAYQIALATIHLLAQDLKPARLQEDDEQAPAGTRVPGLAGALEPSRGCYRALVGAAYGIRRPVPSFAVATMAYILAAGQFKRAELIQLYGDD